MTSRFSTLQNRDARQAHFQFVKFLLLFLRDSLNRCSLLFFLLDGGCILAPLW